MHCMFGLIEEMIIHWYPLSRDVRYYICFVICASQNGNVRLPRESHNVITPKNGGNIILSLMKIWDFMLND